MSRRVAAGVVLLLLLLRDTPRALASPVVLPSRARAQLQLLVTCASGSRLAAPSRRLGCGSGVVHALRSVAVASLHAGQRAVTWALALAYGFCENTGGQQHY